MFFLIRRGRENIRAMKTKTLSLLPKNASGRIYIYQTNGESDKKIMGLTMVPSIRAVKGVSTKQTGENAPLNLF